MVQEFADQQIAQMKKRTAEAGRPVTCCAGCSACCYEPVYCDSWEMEHALAGLSGDQLDYVKARLAQWVRLVEPSGLLKQELPSAFAWRALKVPCPFLRETLCMIYDRRPCSCRMHMATGPRINYEDDKLREQQTFVTSPEATENIALVSVAKYKGGNYDHLGAWLAKLLFGQNLQSATQGHIDKAHSKKNKLFYA